MSLASADLDQRASVYGFTRRGKQNWIRSTGDFVQLINLQKSAWSNNDGYWNFAMWLLTQGQPPSIAESKFHFRMRVPNLETALEQANTLKTLVELRSAMSSGKVVGLTSITLQQMLKSA